MFYSHEVLTSRKYGVATVWLVATLGAKSSLKRINRKQILDVDVSKACQTIVDPVAPMALRLQGSLLYGVSRVYLQQCGYVLSDAQNAQNALRMMLRTVENLGLDPEAGKAKPDTLILQDDPSFLPEHALALPSDLLDLNLDLDLPFEIVRSGDSQSLTPFASQFSQQSSSHAGDFGGGIVIPSSSSPAPLGEFRIQGADEDVDMTGLMGNDAAFQFEEPDFTFDEDGMVVEGPSIRSAVKTPVGVGRVGVRGDVISSGKGKQGHGDAAEVDAQIPDDPIETDLPNLGDDLPDGTSPVAHPQSSEQGAEVVHSTSTVSAPMRQKRRVAHTIPHDSTVEIKNRELASWNNNYLQNMEVARLNKNKNRAPHQAKKDAEQYVFGNGIGDISNQFLGMPVPSPFDFFIGDKLFALVTGSSRAKRGRPKRDRDSGIDDETQEESRNVRQKTTEPEHEVGRGHDDEGFFPLGDDEVELPREAPSPLDDQQIFSAMPWNISASIRGSSAVPRSALNKTDQGRPGSRLVSASPLHGRGPPMSAEALKNLTSDGDFGFGDDFGGPEPTSSIEQDPAATTYQPTTRVTEALSAEGENFFLFVNEAIVEKRNRLQEEGGETTDEVTLEELLPPAQNNRMVASQGLMMVLGLGTKGMLDVQQSEHFGDISLKLTEKAKESLVVEISDGEESDSDATIQGDDVVAYGEEVDGDEEMQDNGHGQFEEQFAAGRAGQKDSDHASLYEE